MTFPIIIYIKATVAIINFNGLVIVSSLNINTHLFFNNIDSIACSAGDKSGLIYM